MSPETSTQILVCTLKRAERATQLPFMFLKWAGYSEPRGVREGALDLGRGVGVLFRA